MDLIYNITNLNHSSHTMNIERYLDKPIALAPVKMITINKDRYILFSTNQLNIQIGLDEDYINESNQNFTSVNNCIDKCQKVLGLKSHEIAKLLKISRATLDLNQKNSNIQSLAAYDRLYKFITDVENLHGDKLKNYTRNVLIERKTIIQHLIICRDKLDTTFPLLDVLSNKISSISISENKYVEHFKLKLRTYGIGKMA